MSEILDNIEKGVRVGVLDALEAEGRPMTMTALTDQVEAAADMDDINTALERLLADRLVVKYNGRYGLPRTDGSTAQRARDAGPQRPAKRPTDAVAAVLSAAGEWLTIAEIETRVAGLTARQIKDALQSQRFQSRGCSRGASPATKEYGLADWPAPAAPKAEPRSRLERTISALTAADRWLLAEDIAATLNEPLRGLQTTLKNGVYNGRLAALYSEVPGCKRYGLPGWSQPQPATPVEGAAAPRYGLFSDGALSIEAGAGDLELAPAETRALVSYLIASGSQISALFDDEVRHA